MKDLINKDPIRYTLLGIGICIVLILVFGFGVSVGYKKAAYSGRLGDNYRQVFIQRDESNIRGSFEKGFGPFENIPEGHGAVGKIINVNPPYITVSTRDNLEKTVIVTDNTAIKKFRDDIKITDLQTGEMIITFGKPSAENDGNIEALLIRVAPDKNNNQYEERQ